MAIGSPAPPHHASPAANQHTGIDIDAWTISALQSLSVSPIARGTGTPLSIPIDDHVRPPATGETKAEIRTVKLNNGADKPATPGRSTPFQRDSMARREALLKGKEGSRQRRRWENGMLASNSRV